MANLRRGYQENSWLLEGWFTDRTSSEHASGPHTIRRKTRGVEMRDGTVTSLNRYYLESDDKRWVYSVIQFGNLPRWAVHGTIASNWPRSSLLRSVKFFFHVPEHSDESKSRFTGSIVLSAASAIPTPIIVYWHALTVVPNLIVDDPTSNQQLKPSACSDAIKMVLKSQSINFVLYPAELDAETWRWSSSGSYKNEFERLY